MGELRLFFISTCLLTTFCHILPQERLYALDIVHYNDFHARFEETSVHYPVCRFNNGSCLGGFPRLYKEITTLLNEKPDALLLNVGDSFQGTYWYTLLKWNVTQEFMNLLPHDAHAIGNHEFDDGPEGLAPYLSHLKAPALAANMDVSQEPVLQGLFQSSIVVEKKGRKIGIIGLATQETAYLSSPGKVMFTDPGEATDREVKKLKEQGVDIILLLSHCGLTIDRKLAHDHGEYIDIIIGGHTHSLLWNGIAPSGETVAAPYPVFVESNKDVKHKVLIVQASAFTKYMGNLTVFFDDRGEYVKWEGGPIFLDRSIPEDEEIKSKLQPYAQLVREAENIRIGETTTTLLAEDCAYGECPLGNFIVDTIQAVAKTKVDSDYDSITFMPSSTIKASFPQGSTEFQELIRSYLITVLYRVSKPQPSTSSGLGSVGRPKKSFDDSSLKTKRRRVEDLLEIRSASELTVAAELATRKEGHRSVAKQIKEIGESPKKNKCSEQSRQLTPDEALAYYVDSKSTCHSYKQTRKWSMKAGHQVYPSLYSLGKSKASCPSDEHITVTESRAEIKLQAILNKTAERLVEAQCEVIRSVLPRSSYTLLSEEAQEARNKDCRRFRERHTRKRSRIATNTDLLRMLLITSDPVINTFREVPKKKITALPAEVLQLVIPPSLPTQLSSVREIDEEDYVLSDSTELESNDEESSEDEH
ncbi:apyrase-like [Hyposmocoma kahamanoa]|uniref:apyrase-like n=1 Tax=Hyposmocoma kahamanoa TaxID=1477025 RepID=UPI000E6D9731|nr:apyrase-like [Hyposmocoma kahamanoa]